MAGLTPELTGQEREVKKGEPVPATPLEKVKAFAKKNLVALTLAVVGILVLKFVGKDLAWPALLLLFAAAFRDGLLSLFETLNRLASRAKTLTIGSKDRALTVDIDVAAGVLEELVAAAVEDLTPEQKNLFLFICENVDVKVRSLGDGPLKFEMIDPPPRSILHEDLRAIRDFNLIRGMPRRRFLAESHIDITPFGTLVRKITSFGSFDKVAFAEYLKIANCRPFIPGNPVMGDTAGHA
jgi:hypothetical protein